MSTLPRIRVNKYLDEGHTQRETRTTFHISMTAINSWRKKYKETGHVMDDPPRRTFKKLDPVKLKAYVKEHPDAYLKEIGEVFGCSDTAVLKAFKRLNITRKKGRNTTANKSQSR
jgi:transposase